MASYAQTWPRVVDFDRGTAVVVTDLHGDWDAYQRYRDQFLLMHARGQVDFFFLLGDLIHHSGPPQQDKSVEIVLDLLQLQSELDDRLICLLGNHELAHIYAFPLAKGNELYTPPFEQAMGAHREKILAFFDAMPFYIRTGAGVTLCHAGAASAISEKDARQRLFTFSHQATLEETAVSLPLSERPYYRKQLAKRYGRSYDELARTYFAVSPDEFHRYDDFLIGTTAIDQHSDAPLLWSAFFNKNELEYGRRAYQLILEAMLQQLSYNYVTQRVMITGHIDVKGGYKLIGDRQLRLASAKHAQPREAGRFLLLDLGKPVASAAELVPSLASVFN